MRAARLISRAAHNTPDWHAARAGYIGGSEIAAVLGLSPWVSRYALWMLKAGRDTGQPDSEQFRRGHYLEPSLLAWLQDQHPELAIRRGRGIYVSTRWPYASASPDALCFPADTPRFADAVGELKSDADYWAWGDAGTDQVPVYYRCQGIWYCGVLGLPRVIFAVLLGSGLTFKEYVVDFDVDEFDWMRAQARAFLGTVWRGEVPNTDADHATYECVKRMHPDIDDVEVEVEPDVAYEFVRTDLAVKELTDEARAAKAALAVQMGNARRAVVTLPSGSVCRVALRKPRRGGPPSLELNRPNPSLAALAAALPPALEKAS